jgi:hypothetical protein
LSSRLSESQLDRLLVILVEHLTRIDLTPPQAGEREPRYTARVLVPSLKRVVDELEIHGLFLMGPAAAPMHPVYVLGARFFPDVAISFHASPVVAIEVKFLTQQSAPGRLASALGQAAIYRAGGYRRAMVLALDYRKTISAQDLLELNRLFDEWAGLRVVARTFSEEAL